ncbi:MAG: iron-containing alcohol dehydrogenase, partial [Treponemataceae bacterium]
ALLAPQFTATCPPKVTAEAGFDVLSHILESYVSINSQTFTEALVEKVIGMVFNALPSVYKNGHDMSARLVMHEASCLAGIAFTNSGLGLNHAMAHSLGGRFKISHGRANALLMPHVIAFNCRSAAEKYERLAHRLGISGSTQAESCIALITAVASLSKSIDIPCSVVDFGVNKNEYLDALSNMAQAVSQDPCITTNPVVPTIADIERIYQSLI